MPSSRRAGIAKAEEQFREAIALRPDRPGPWNNLGTALATQERYAEAEALVRARGGAIWRTVPATR